MTKKEKIADLKKRIEEWDRKRLGMAGLRLLKFQLADLDRNFPLHDQFIREQGMRLSPEDYQMDLQNRLNKRLDDLADEFNRMLVDEAEKLEQANKEKRSWEKVTQEILFNHSEIGS